jgi:transposase
MDKEDARYQNLLQLHERRKQVIRLYTLGYPIMKVAELSGLSYPTVRRAINNYQQGGLQAIVPRGRGRKNGEGRSLSVVQEEMIGRIIREKTPHELGIEHSVWTRVAVMELTAKECGIQLTVRGVGNYLKRWKFKPQKASKAKASVKKKVAKIKAPTDLPSMTLQ